MRQPGKGASAAISCRHYKALQLLGAASLSRRREAGAAPARDLERWVQSSPRDLRANDFAGAPEATLTRLTQR